MIVMAQSNAASDKTTNRAAGRARRWSFRYSLRTLFGLLTAFCVSWGLTISVGIPDVSRYCLSKLEQDRSDSSTRLEFDPMYDRESSPRPIAPCWHYVGDGKSPLPFVVSVHVAAVRENGTGVGERDYFIWLFGIKINVWATSYWSGG
jgi:hypothetical protein